MKRANIFFILVFISVKILAIDTVAVKIIGDGVKYYHLKTEEPNNIYILKVDLTLDNKIKLGIANDRIGNEGATVNEMSKNLSKNNFVFAGVNADFFGGSPYQFENSMVIDGEFAKGINIGRSLFAVSEDNVPMIDTIKFIGTIINGKDTISVTSLNDENDSLVCLYNKYYNIKQKLDDEEVAVLLKPESAFKLNILQKYRIVNLFYNSIPKFLYVDKYLLIMPKKLLNNNPFVIGDTLSLSLGLSADFKNIKQMIGGLPKILRSGKEIENFAGHEGINNSGFFGKNPRTAIGYDQAKKYLYIVAIDGRDNTNSIGMTLPELSKFMKDLGCYEALNFDGGGSTTMVIRDSTVNKPTDLTGERKVFNSLFLCAKNITPDIFNSIKVSTSKTDLKLYEKVDLVIEAHDCWGFSSFINSENINFCYDNNLCFISNNELIANKSGITTIKWNFGKFNGEFTIKID